MIWTWLDEIEPGLIRIDQGGSEWNRMAWTGMEWNGMELTWFDLAWVELT
jgi:hypothetical protein